MYLAVTKRGEKCSLNISDAGPRFGATKLAVAIFRAAAEEQHETSRIAVEKGSCQRGRPVKVRYQFEALEKLMKTLTGRLCTFTLISLLSLFTFAVQSGAQSHTFNQLNDLPMSAAESGNNQEAKSEAKPSYSVLYNFCSVVLQGGICGDGSEPGASLIQDAAGNLYGTTVTGGNGDGTVFKVDTTGSETVLYSFCSIPSCADGRLPQAGLIQDTAGNLYGTTSGGGANGYGTVFKVDSTGNERCSTAFALLRTVRTGPSPSLA